MGNEGENFTKYLFSLLLKKQVIAMIEQDASQRM